jgi:uncharacterized protein
MQMHGVVDPDFAECAIELCGQTMILARSGVLYWPAQDLLIVADLHLEKGTAQASFGRFLPPYDTRATLARLAAALAYFEPAAVIALGDSLHDRRAAGRLDEADLATLALLQAGRDWCWVTGNHDPEIPAILGGTVSAEVELGALTLRHEPRGDATAQEIAGHLHPAARFAAQGAIVRRPCFVSNGQRMILPAFGSFTGGLNVLDSAFTPVFGQDELSVWMLGSEGIYPVPARGLRGD